MVKKFNSLFSFVHSVVRSLHMGSEPQDASHAQSGLHSRLSSQLKACSAAALLAVGGLADADAAVVHWQNANLLIPNTIDGLYINVETQATGSAGSVTAGWDINPYSATSLTWFNATGTGMMRFPGVTTGSAGNLAPGTEINATRSYGSGAVVVGSAPGNWQLNASNYFGFRFVASDGLTHYGWGRFVIGASISGTDRMIAELAYESVPGTAITIAGSSAPLCTAPSLSGLVTDAGCSGATNGGVNLTATGGSPTPLSYLWSNGAITEDLLNVGPGTYSVTVTAGTCSTSASYTVGTAAQAPQPTIACYQTATYNNTTCQWDVSGIQPAQPSLACYESATFNTTTCSWDVSGSQPAQPTGLACHETATFNTTTCAWVVTSSANITTDTAFGSYTWSANGQTYTNSGTYTIVPAVTSTVYSSLSTFNAAVSSAGYSLSSTQDFNVNDPTSGSFGPISWSASANGGLWFCQTPTNSLSTNGYATPITFTFNPGVVAVGAHVFLTDASCAVVPGNVSVSLSDGTTQTISTSSNQDFLGFVSGGSLITSITFSPSNQFITIDDLVIGTGTPSGSSTPCATDILNLTIIPGAPVGGTVVYDNSASSPMRNAVVVLKQGNAEVVRDTTDATGAFLLPLVAPGTYDVVVTSNTPWGGVNATDAVLILRSFSGSAPLNGIRLTAADVNGSASVNSTDALNALNRFTGALQTFSVGNYTASTSSYTASGAGTGSLNVSMLCYGDVNASYQPNGGFVRTSWEDLSTQGVARITSGSYEVPLFVSRGVQPAGVSLELELPEGLRVLGVRASEGLRANQVVYHQEGNRVRMAWLDESGAELKAGDVLCYVQVEGAVEGVWRSSTEVELANVLGEVQSGVELRMPKLSASLGAMEASVYPNPGRGLRTLSLELSEGMGVAVRVTDALGRTVYTHTAGTLASGTHLMELNMEGWPVGSYQVQVLGATAEGKTHQRSITVLQTR
jgi:hypothetical protein